MVFPLAAKTFELKSLLLRCGPGAVTYSDPVPHLESLAAAVAGGDITSSLLPAL